MLAAIESEGSARVLVALAQRAPRADDAGRKGLSIAESVLADTEARGLEVVRRFTHIDAFAAVVDEDELQRLARHPKVRRIDLDAPGRGLLNEARTLAHFSQVNDSGVRGLGTIIAILDSGVNSAHPDLGGSIIDQACFCSGDDGCCPNGATTQFGLGADEDDNGHGSNVTGVMISDGFVSPLGVAPKSELIAVKVLDAFASFCCSSDVVAGLDWLITNHPDVDVVNMSLGTSAIFAGDCDDATSFTMAFAQAIGTLRAGGSVTVSSAGNDGSGTSMSAPACVADVISVGAAWDDELGAQLQLGCADTTTQPDQITCYSNTSPTLDLIASGNPMTSAGLFANTSSFIGTSNAAPLVSACAALLREVDPSLTPSEIETALESSPVLLTDATNGLSFPRLDCLAALESTGWVMPRIVGPGPAALTGLAIALGLVGAKRLRLRAGRPQRHV